MVAIRKPLVVVVILISAGQSMMTLAGVRASDTLAHELLRVEHEANGEPEAAPSPSDSSD